MSQSLQFNSTNYPKGKRIQIIRQLLLFALLLTVQVVQAQLNVTFNVQEPTCSGLPNGRIVASASGGTAPYTYLWNTGVMGGTLNNISAGAYSVTVSDAGGNSIVRSVTLNQPASVTANITISGNCSVPFNLTAVGGGGVSPYKYFWSNGQSTQTITVNNGSYCVTITDNNSCGAVKCITVNPTPLTLSAVASPLSCPDGNDGSVTANPVGGTAPYTYLWSNGATTQSISNLTFGTYRVTVTDARNCTATALATVANRQAININTTTVQPNCSSDTNGSITASATGGSAPYTFVWSTGATAQTISNLVPGTYSVTVLDNKGCTSSKTIILDSKSKLSVNVTGQHETCPNARNGSVVANPIDGIGPFTYLWNTGATSKSLTILAPGTYSVTVTDFVGCKASGSFTVNPGAPFSISLSKTDATNCTGDNGTATVTINGGTAPFDYTWSNGAKTATVQGLSAGFYSVMVMDARGCMAMGSVTITAPPPVNVVVNATARVCPGATNGTAKATASGGKAPYTYRWNNGVTTDSISNLGSGIYRVTVTDANGCSATAADTILQSPALNININSAPIVCGSNTTNATVQVNGGLPPFGFLWSTGATTQTITGATPGFYSVTVSDANGCTATTSITIRAVNLRADITKRDIPCFGQNTGFARARAIGGDSPYSYRWNTGANTDSIVNLAAGNYTVTITDANGCTATNTVIINQPPDLVLIMSGDTLVCPGENTGFVKASISGGTSPYTYIWNNGATRDSIGGLGAGTYRITVTDANGCQRSASFNIIQSPPITINLEATEVVCGSEDEGSASASVSGGRPPYTFRWSNGLTTPRIENLTTGSYSLTVTDANGCTATKEVSITVVSDFAISAVPRNVLCSGDNSGSILITARGGKTPYTYRWNNGRTTAEITNLTAGSYTVTVTDGNGCSLTQTLTITQPPLLTVTTSRTNINCFGNNNGTASVTVSGGTAPYSYRWNNNATTPNISNLTPGTYSVTVTDANFCTQTASVVITQSTQLNGTATATNILCNGQNNGSAVVNVTGGTTPYTYLWSTGATTQTITNRPAGTYIVTTTDANGCSTIDTAIITQPPILQVNLTVSNIVCTAQQIGAISAIVTGGTSPYTYRWSNNATTAAIANLPAGSYSVTVTDANGCTATGTAGVAQIPNLMLTISRTNVSCFGAGDGTATVTVSGDVPPYRYIWSNGDTTATADNLTPGNYRVTVTGSAGCVGEANVTITQPTVLITQTTKVDVSCNTGSTGRASVTVSGGTPPYVYAWNTGASTSAITNLGAGTYTVTVTDANECSDIDTVVINQPNPINVTVNVTKGTCEGDSSGNIGTNVTGGTSPYTYRWSNGQTTPNLNNVSAGNYTVTVTDSRGCTATGTVTMTAFKKPTCSISLVNDSTAQVIPSGGTPPYTYVWSTTEFTDIVRKLQIGIYKVTVTDANGCTTSCEIDIKGPAIIGDFVWLDVDRDGIQDPGEPGIPNVTVILSGTVEDETYRDSTKTNANGIYQFQVPPPGTYKVTFVLPPGSGLVPTLHNAGSDDAKDSDAHPTTLMTHLVTVKKGDIDLTLDAGFYEFCVNLGNPGTIGYDQYLCGPGVDPAPIVEVTPPAGGQGAIEYLWMKSTVGGPFNNIHWQPIEGATSKNYDPGPIYETTYFIRCTRRENCEFLETNIVTIVVGNQVVAKIEGPDLACSGTPVTFRSANPGAASNFAWDFGPAANPRYASGAAPTVTFSSFGVFQIKLTMTQGNCTSTAVKTINVTSLCGGLQIDVNAIDNEEVMVNWTVPEDGENYQFLIEHSNNGETFQSIGQVLFPTNVNAGMRSYEYLDPAPKRGWNYYRVMAVDRTGKKTYSEVEELVLYADSELMHLYPNPVRDILTLEIFETLNDDVQLQVVNTSGVVLQTVKAPADVKRQELDFSDYPAGTYFIKVRYGKIDVKVLKVLKN
ncbi:MAG: SdrD B-like domain-containing protein [Saprospiraceae bacterium]